MFTVYLKTTYVDLRLSMVSSVQLTYSWLILTKFHPALWFNLQVSPRDWQHFILDGCYFQQVAVEHYLAPGTAPVSAR